MSGNSAKTKKTRLSVLLVDDNRLNSILLSEILKTDNHVVTVVMSGRAAIEQASQQNFDLILMDVQMPGMDGIETTKAIRSLPPPYRNVPIIALTAGSFAIDEKHCLAAGMNAYLTKPVGLADLQREIHRIFPDAPAHEIPHTPRPSKPSDEERMEELLRNMGKEGALRMISLFVPDAEGIIARISAILTRGAKSKDDRHELARQVHNLKASARLLGLSALAEEAVSFELAIGNNRLDIWPQKLAELQAGVELAKLKLAETVQKMA
jgi:CheY-like chemotaxis protein/HPt (histidine-containing phosphotransfer) domain-containing protein